MTSELLAMAKNTHCPQVLRARHLLTSVLLAMAPKVWMHKPDIPGLLVVRIVEKHSLSTGQIGPRQKKIPVKHSTNFVQNPGPSKAVTNICFIFASRFLFLFNFA